MRAEEHTVGSLDELSLFAEELAGNLNGGETLGLVGDLGAGKTTLTKQLAKAFSTPDRVTSPTYVLEQEYRTKGSLVLQHWDLYRLDMLPDELHESPKKDIIRIIEWIDKFPNYMKEVEYLVKIVNPLDPDSAEKRVISFEKRVTL